MNDVLQTPSTPTIATTPSPPSSLKTIQHTSRFTEHFDIVLPPAAFELFLLDASPPPPPQQQQQQRSMSISTSRPSVFAKPVRMHSSPAITTTVSSSSSSIVMEDKQQPTTTTTTTENNNNLPAAAAIITTSSTSTVTKQQQQQSIPLLYKDYHASTTNSLNRADMMIKRLGNWLVFLKLSAGWLVEIQKMTASGAFKRLKKDHPERYDQINKKRKECQNIISQFKKECRDKIHSLKINPALQMEELLLRANETRKRMTHLSKLCDLANDSKQPHLPELDPWLANLHVLRYLKRETTEENRLRTLMVAIQQDMQALELKLTDAFDDIVSFCVEQETTVTQYGSTLDQVLDHFLPQHTWSSFVAAQQEKKDWVDQDHIQKNYLQINYPNKQHTHVATVKKGVLGRRSGVLKHYHDKYFVLTHYGYLHQFKLEDKFKPEASIYVTSTIIQPQVNDDDLLFDDQQQQSMGDDSTTGYTFDIRQQKRNKNYHFKTTTGLELVSWCRGLTNVANGSSVEKLLAQRKKQQLSKPLEHNTRSNNNTTTITSQGQQQQQQQQYEDIPDDDYDDDFHSIHDHHDSPLVENDLLSLDIGSKPTIPSSSSTTTTSRSSSFSLDQQQPQLQDESGIYFSSTSSPGSSSSPPPRRAVPTYQANLNLMVTSSPS